MIDFAGLIQHGPIIDPDHVNRINAALSEAARLQRAALEFLEHGDDCALCGDGKLAHEWNGQSGYACPNNCGVFTHNGLDDKLAEAHGVGTNPERVARLRCAGRGTVSWSRWFDRTPKRRPHIWGAHSHGWLVVRVVPMTPEEYAEDFLTTSPDQPKLTKAGPHDRAR